jgi:putative DNA methylase
MVLKDDGVLAFSFHNSRAEGWAAIYEAINKAGLAVVAAHPVHAELRAASPKTAAKDPISLDAILVCRKKAFALHQPLAIPDVRQSVDALSSRLQAAGLHISAGDRFVIGAAQTLISRAADDLSFDAIKADLDAIRLHVGPNAIDADDIPEAASAESASV